MTIDITTLDESFLPYCHEEQIEVLEMYLKKGSSRKAAKALGKHDTSIRRTLKRIIKRAAAMGHSPHEDQNGLAPAGFAIKGKSTFYDDQGRPVRQWVKTERDKEAQAEAMREFVEELAQPLKGIADPVKPPKKADDNLAAAYIIGDGHFGMLSWDEETGHNYDSDIAESLHKQAIDYLVQAAPDAGTGLLISVGDLFHADNNVPLTPQSKNVLDVDSRFQRVRRIAAFTMMYMIQRMLEKHQKVRVLCAPGNHDPMASNWLAFALSLRYERDPRVEVDTSPSKHLWVEFGQNLLLVTHGDSVKINDMPALMANHGMGKPWGRCHNRYAFSGHIHHQQVIEKDGVTCQSFRVLPPPDAWHSSSGYIGQRREMTMQVFDKEHGMVGSAVWNVSRAG